MEDFNFNNMSQVNSSDYTSTSGIAMFVVTCTIVSIGLPLTLVAIYALYSLVQNDHVAPIYVINLLISDLIQFCSMVALLAPQEDENLLKTGYLVYVTSLMASVGFMVCIALERYLVIACPLWYRFRRNLKISVAVCVVVWTLPFVYLLIYYFWSDDALPMIVFGIFFLLPLPLFIFFLGGSIRVLTASGMPSDEKRRIIGILVLVLLIYTLLFLPTIIMFLAEHMYDAHFYNMSGVFLQLSPLADLLLYVFMKKGIVDKLLASVCWCRMDSNDVSRMDSNGTSSPTV